MEAAQLMLDSEPGAAGQFEDCVQASIRLTDALQTNRPRLNMFDSEPGASSETPTGCKDSPESLTTGGA